MSEVASALTRARLRASSSFSLAGTAQWRKLITIHNNLYI